MTTDRINRRWSNQNLSKSHFSHHRSYGGAKAIGHERDLDFQSSPYYQKQRAPFLNTTLNFRISHNGRNFFDRRNNNILLNGTLPVADRPIPATALLTSIVDTVQALSCGIICTTWAFAKDKHSLRYDFTYTKNRNVFPDVQFSVYRYKQGWTNTGLFNCFTVHFNSLNLIHQLMHFYIQ
jgi:hypothetical protein